MALEAIATKSYYGDFAETWSYIQGVYAKQDNDTTDVDMTRRSFFRNSALSVVAQIDHQPETRSPMLASLSDYIDLASASDGLEFFFLTLINAANVDQDQTAFDLAVSVWMANATVAKVNGAGPMGFYDLKSRKMAIFDDSQQNSIRNGVDLVYGSDIAGALLSKGSEVLDDPYGFGLAPSARRHAAKEAAHKLRFRELDAVPSASDVWIAGAYAVGNSVAAAGAALALFPSPDPATKATAGVLMAVGGAIDAGAAIVDFGIKLAAFESQSTPTDSTASPTVPDGGLCIDNGGNIGVQNPDVDAGASYDTSAGDGGSLPGGVDNGGGGNEGGDGNDGDGGGGS